MVQMTAQLENILPANSDTLLTISSFGNMLYQARGLTQTLSVIGAATQLERTINGNLIDLSVAQFRKYASKITSPNETDTPPLDGVFPGMHVPVQWAGGLAFLPTRGNGPHHPPEGSGSAYTEGASTF